MPGGGIIWASIICIPFWLIVILLVKAGIITMETIIFVGLILSVMLLVLIFVLPQETNQDDQVNQLFIPATKAHHLFDMKMELKMNDNGGNRIGIDRRIFEYSAYIPEKRLGIDRRKGFDRRNSITRRRVSERRNVLKIEI
jgi:hypothetical protein